MLTPGMDKGMTRKKNNSKQKAAAKAVKKPAAPQAQEPRRNIFKIESELFAKKYTNERIYKQIDNDSCLFFTILGMLIFAAAIITASFVNAYKDVSAEASFGNWLNSVRTDHPLGLVFGITIIIVACVGIGERAAEGFTGQRKSMSWPTILRQAG